jgi:uncharacterized protein YcfJ
MYARIITTLAAALGMGLAGVAQAGHDEEPYESRGRYETARVVRVEPIVRLVRVSTPRRECWDEDYYVTESAPPRGTAGGAIAGAIIGGVIGHQFGKGRGKDAATVAGALMGSAIGTDHAARDNWHRERGRDEHRLRTRTRCDVSHDWREEERVDGYRVTYEFDGERYVTRMNRDPGETIKVWVSVRPVGD